jgi:predicted SAM-dependent methyltransferase
MKLNVGCGINYLPGWVNIDTGPYKVDLVHNITKKFPYPNNSVSLIYCEHVIEHLSKTEGDSFINNCYSILIKNGVLRIATFDLDEVIQKYITDWKDQYWIESHPHIKNRAQMLNAVFHDWGHKWIYNAEELTTRIIESNFGNSVRVVTYRNSTVSELCNLETRPNSTLIVEAIKV